MNSGFSTQLHEAVSAAVLTRVGAGAGLACALSLLPGLLLSAHHCHSPLGAYPGLLAKQTAPDERYPGLRLARPPVLLNELTSLTWHQTKSREREGGWGRQGRRRGCPGEAAELNRAEHSAADLLSPFRG